MTTKFIIKRDEQTIWRERGFSDGNGGKPRRTELPSAVAAASYAQGFQLGLREKKKRR